MEHKAEELKCLKNEFDWLLTDELPSILVQLKEILQICLHKFRGRPGKVDSLEQHHMLKGNNFLLSLPSSDAVRGLINITGDSVIKAELRFKFPKISSNAIGTFIFEQCPWKLSQLQATHNQLKLAYEAILEEEFTGSVTQGDHVSELMSRISSSLCQARNALIVPHKQDLSQIIAMNNQILNPPTPEEIVISFHVNCDKVVLCVYVLNTVTGPAQTQRHHSPHESSIIGYTFQHHGKWFEVINKIEIICAVPWLKDMIVWINSAQQLCQQLKDKIEIFNNILPREMRHLSSSMKVG